MGFETFRRRQPTPVLGSFETSLWDLKLKNDRKTASLRRWFETSLWDLKQLLHTLKLLDVDKFETSLWDLKRTEEYNFVITEECSKPPYGI